LNALQRQSVSLKKDIDTTAESPLFFPHEIESRMMEDKLEESLPRETALANGPDTGYTSFNVPRIVAEE
jgi:Asp-tRNA(Asn)/Glu-tRNA(Gln) amidotransferase C subunit